MLRKPALLSAYGKSNCITFTQHTTTPSLHRFETGECEKANSFTTPRRYASVNTNSDSLDWPDLRPAGTTPTPYQIFRLKKEEPYSKRRFYELVKLYHPDKHDHEDCAATCGHLPAAVKSERYRLVVAANDILSDPGKRRAYDAYGTGWKENPSIKVRYERSKGPTDIPWSGFRDNASAFHNATWEDWERWYGHHYKSRQKLKYFRNESFVSLVACAALLGAVGHYTEIDNRQARFVNQVHLKNDAASGQLTRAKESSQSFASRDQKIHSFLRQREASGLIPDDDGDQSNLLPSPDKPSPKQQRGEG